MFLWISSGSIDAWRCCSMGFLACFTAPSGCGDVLINEYVHRSHFLPYDHFLTLSSIELELPIPTPSPEGNSPRLTASLGKIRAMDLPNSHPSHCTQSRCSAVMDESTARKLGPCSWIFRPCSWIFDASALLNDQRGRATQIFASMSRESIFAFVS